MAPQKSKRSFDILPEPIETSTRSVRQKPESPAQSHGNSLPLPVETSKRSHRQDNNNMKNNTPLTSQHFSAMCVEVDRSDRVSPRSLPSSACPSLSTSPGSTRPNSPDHFHHEQDDSHSNIPNIQLAGVFGGSVGKEAGDEDIPAPSDEQSRVFPMQAPARVGGSNIGARVVDNNSNNSAPHENLLQPTEEDLRRRRGVVSSSTSPGTHETQIISDNSKSATTAATPTTPKPKNIHIPSHNAVVESPMHTTLMHRETSGYFSSSSCSSNNTTVKRSPSPGLWSSPSRSPSPGLWCSNAPRPTEKKMSTCSSSSTSSNSTALTVPPSSSIDDKSEKADVEITTSKISLWRPASPVPRAASPCLWTKPSSSASSSSSAPKPSLPTYQATETLTDEEAAPPTVLCPTKPCEVHVQFVQQVYRYLSFDHECMARGYDYELAEVTGVSVQDVRADRFSALKKYVEDYIGRVPGIRTGQGW